MFIANDPITAAATTSPDIVIAAPAFEATSWWAGSQTLPIIPISAVKYRVPHPVTLDSLFQEGIRIPGDPYPRK